MRVTEHLAAATEPPISFEIIPPLRGGDIKSLLDLIEDLVKHRPPFIDITSHAAEVVYEETADGIKKRTKRKRPGTLGVCALIQNKYHIDAVPHVLCNGFNRQETEDFLIELRYLGIDNVLAIRGDDPGFRKPLAPGKSINPFAVDLIGQIAAMNRGEYLEELLDAQETAFCIGTSGYPEKHFEAPNLESDVRWAKRKVEAGAEYICTQMFFDNEHYFNYLALCRKAGIEVPIIPGLKILRSRRQLSSIPRTFHCEIPPALADEIERAKPQDAEAIGIRWGVEQARELLERGAPSLHFYVMQNSTAINALIAQLRR